MSDRYKGSNISPFSTGSTRACHICTALLPEASMTRVHPVPGLTMYRCPACEGRLQRILAYARTRWCWDDPAMLEELYARHGIDTTPEAFVDAWADHYDLTDPRHVGL